MGGLVHGSLLLAGVLSVPVSILLLWTFVLSRRDALPLNWVVGLRTSSIMRSERVWTEIHRRYAGLFLLDGLIFAACAAVGILGSATSLLEEAAARDAVGGMTVAFLCITVVGGVFAHLHARRMNRTGWLAGDSPR